MSLVVVYDCRLGGRINVIIVRGDDRPIWLVEYDRWRDEQWEENLPSGRGEFFQPADPTRRDRRIRDGATDLNGPVLGRFNEKDFRSFVVLMQPRETARWWIERAVKVGLAARECT